MKKIILSLSFLAFAGYTYSQIPAKKFMQSIHVSDKNFSKSTKSETVQSKSTPLWEDDFSDIEGQVDTLDNGSITQGGNYINMVGVPTSGGNGTGLTVNIMVEQNDYFLDIETLFGGSGYTTATDVPVTVDPAESNGEDMLVNIEAATLGGVSAYEDLVGGDEYVNAENVTTTGGAGTGLTVDITTVQEGPVVDLNDASLDGGEGYTTSTDVTTTSNGAGTGLTVDIVADADVITSVTINTPGTGYSVGDIIIVEGGTVDATIEVAEISGAIEMVEINNTGADYVIGNVITIDGGDGLATFTVSEITNGEVVSVTISDEGNGQYGIGDVLTITDGDELATIVIGAMTGPITSVEVNDIGEGYEIGDVVTLLDGDGTATISVDNVVIGKGWNTISEGQGNWSLDNTPPNSLTSYMGNMQSTTESNGFAYFNGIDFLYDSNVNPQNAWVETYSPIDLSDHEFVRLSFEQRYMAYNTDQTFVEVSTDGGNTWGFSTEVNQDIAALEPSVQNTINFNVNVSNSSDVKIRFRWFNSSSDNLYGSGIGWMVDDVKVFEVPEHDLTMKRLDWKSVNHNYGEIPISQVTEIDFSGIVLNSGRTNQENITLSAIVNETELTSSTFTLDAFESDSITIGSFTPNSEIGSYNVDVYVSSPEEDANPVDDTIKGAAMFNVNEYIYARDKGLPNYTGSAFNFEDDAYEIGNEYDIFGDDELWAVDAFIRGDTPLETSLFVRLYDIEGNFIDESDSYLVDSTTNLGDFLTLKLLNAPHSLTAGESYIVTIGTYGGQDGEGLKVGTSGRSEVNTSFAILNDTWYYLTSTPMVRMNFDKTLNINSSYINNFNLNVYPNPAREYANVAFELENAGDVSFVLTDMSGKVVYQTNEQNLSKGKNSFRVPTESLSGGVYLYQFNAGNTVVNNKLIINK